MVFVGRRYLSSKTASISYESCWARSRSIQISGCNIALALVWLIYSLRSEIPLRLVLGHIAIYFMLLIVHCILWWLRYAVRVLTLDKLRFVVTNRLINSLVMSRKLSTLAAKRIYSFYWVIKPCTRGKAWKPNCNFIISLLSRICWIAWSRGWLWYPLIMSWLNWSTIECLLVLIL